MTTFNGTEFCLEVVAADCCVVRRGCSCHGDGQRPDVLLRGAASETQTNTTRDYRRGGTVPKSAYYTRLCASFFVKLRGKNPSSRVAVFWAYLKKIWLLVREI